MEQLLDAEAPSPSPSQPLLPSMAALSELIVETGTPCGEDISSSKSRRFFLANEAIIHDTVASREKGYRDFAGVKEQMNALKDELNSSLKGLSNDAADNETMAAAFLVVARFATGFFAIAPFHDGNAETLWSVTTLDMAEQKKAALLELLQGARDDQVADFLRSSTDAVRPQASSAASSSQFAVEKKVVAAERIKQGFKKFKEDTYTKKPELFAELAQAQCPKFMVIACSDSRVSPTTILGFKPGEAFVVRNIANMVPPPEKVGYPGTSAALEYAVKSIKVENILVIGHSRCGGIKALVMQRDNASKESTFIENWIEIGKPARASTLDAAEDIETRCTKCEKESVNVSLTNLLKFQFVEDAVKSGQIALHGGYYNFVDGSFEYWTCGADGKPSEIIEF